MIQKIKNKIEKTKPVEIVFNKKQGLFHIQKENKEQIKVVAKQ